MKAHDPRQEFIVWCLYYFLKSVGRGYMLQDGDRISTQRNLPNFTILDCPLLLSSLTVRGRLVLVEEPFDH